MLSNLFLLLRVLSLVMGYVKQEQAAGRTVRATLHELEKKFDARIDRARDARDAEHDDSVRDPHDRAGDESNGRTDSQTGV
jgi:hypothetical protein